MADKWHKSAKDRAEIVLDEWIVKPNHLHGIVIITGVDLDKRKGGRSVAPIGTKPKSISALISGFKSVTTKRINAIRETPGSPVWQRGYSEYIIRSESSANRIRQYIMENPMRWEEDPEYPAARGD